MLSVIVALSTKCNLVGIDETYLFKPTHDIFTPISGSLILQATGNQGLKGLTFP